MDNFKHNYYDPPIDSTLVAYWKFIEPIPNTIDDISASAHYRDVTIDGFDMTSHITFQTETLLLCPIG